MANRWSHPHGKTSSEVVPFTWQPTQVKHGLTLYPQAKRQSLPISTSNGKYYLTCLVTGRTKLARPEEVVRQLEIARLRDELVYDLKQMAIEVKIKMGSTYASKAADIVIYTDQTKVTPRIIIECKKPNRLDGLDQLTGIHERHWCLFW